MLVFVTTLIFIIFPQVVQAQPARMRVFNEFMAPALGSDETSIAVPSIDGNEALPVNLFTILWTDYEIAPHYRVLYWQRMLTPLSVGPINPGLSILPRDPRFGIRRTEVFPIPELTTAYDLYFQLGLSSGSMASNRLGDVGFRTNTSYVIPKSRFSLGLITEFTVGIFGSNASQIAAQTGSSPPDFFGFVVPWVSYELSPIFATQHFLNFPFRHTSAAGLSWDDPGSAYIQNGIGINMTNWLWTAVMINNYLLAPPTLKNTWASLWVSLTIL